MNRSQIKEVLAKHKVSADSWLGLVDDLYALASMPAEPARDEPTQAELDDDERCRREVAGDMAALEATFGETARDEPLTMAEAGQAWLDTAQEFWDAAKREGHYGAVRWITGTDGELLIYTRGEYRDVLLRNIEAAQPEYFFAPSAQPPEPPSLPAGASQ